jgi:hypothetical protein
VAKKQLFVEWVDRVWTLRLGIHQCLRPEYGTEPWGKRRTAGHSLGASVYILTSAPQTVEVGLEVNQQVYPTPQSHASVLYTYVTGFYCHMGEPKLRTCEIQIKEIKGNFFPYGCGCYPQTLGIKAKM